MTVTSAAHDVVTVRGLRKAYAGRVVVDDLDLDVHTGEVVGLIGANGAGKTTTVECIQGLRRPDAGTVRVLGLDPTRAPDAERLRTVIGSQLQDCGLPDRLRVGEAITLFATGRGRARGAELLEQFGLTARRNTAFASMSGGERQRLFLVLALLNNPCLVILDELTQGLDPTARREVWAAVGQLRDAGTTVLIVTHELDEAQALCDRVIALRAGRILDQGPPEQLVARHAGWATVRFGWPAERPEPVDDLVAIMRRLPGVRDAHVNRGRDREPSRCTVHGERQVIAQVGAELLRHGAVPDDLDVDVPDLETALLHLLDDPTTGAPSHETTPERELARTR